MSTRLISRRPRWRRASARSALADGVGLADDVVGEGEGGEGLTGVVEGGDAGEARTEGLDLGAHGGVGGGREVGLEGDEVGAAGERRELGGDLEGVEGDVGVAEHGDGLAEGGLALGEAGHAAVEEGAGVLAALVGLAGVAVGGLPGGGVGVEVGGDAGPDVLGEGVAGGGEGLFGAGARVLAPQAGDLEGAAAAAVLLGGLGAGDPEAAEAGEGGEAGGEGDAAAGAVAAGAVEGLEERVHRREALGGFGAEAALDDGEEPRGDADVARRGAHLAAGDRGGDLVDRVAGERELVEQGLVEGRAEAELVGGGADVVGPVVLLRGHVGRGPDDVAAAGDADVGAGLGGWFGEVVGGLGVAEAEVEDADAAVVADHRVARLEVAVDEAGGVRGGQAAAGLDEHGDDVEPAAGALLEPGLQGVAADELHGDEHVAVVGADVVDDGDVGVGDAGHGLGLAEQAGLGSHGAAAGAGAQELDGDAAVELGVVGGVDDAHCAVAELLQEGEAADAVAGGEEVALGRGPAVAADAGGRGAVEHVGGAGLGEADDLLAVDDRVADPVAAAGQAGGVEAVEADVDLQFRFAVDGDRAGEVVEEGVPGGDGQGLAGGGAGVGGAAAPAGAAEQALGVDGRRAVELAAATDAAEEGDRGRVGEGGEEVGDPFGGEEGPLRIAVADHAGADADHAGDEEHGVEAALVAAAGLDGGADDQRLGVEALVLEREQARGQVDAVQIEIAAPLRKRGRRFVVLVSLRFCHHQRSSANILRVRGAVHEDPGVRSCEPWRENALMCQAPVRGRSARPWSGLVARPRG